MVEKIGTICIPIGYIEKDTHHFCTIITKNAQPEFNHEKTPGKSKVGDIL